DLRTAQGGSHEFRDHALWQIALASVYVGESEDDRLDRVSREGRIRVRAAGPLRAQLRHTVDGQGHLRMAFVHRKVARLSIDLAARGVEEDGIRFRLPTRFQDVHRPELVRPS